MERNKIKFIFETEITRSKILITEEIKVYKIFLFGGGNFHKLLFKFVLV